MAKYKVEDFCDEANGVIKELAERNVILYKQRDELLGRLKETQEFIEYILNYFGWSQRSVEEIEQMIDLNEKAIQKIEDDTK